MQRFEQRMTVLKWYEQPPESPTQPDLDDTWKLVAVINDRGTTVLCFWQREKSETGEWP